MPTECCPMHSQPWPMPLFPPSALFLFSTILYLTMIVVVLCDRWSLTRMVIGRLRLIVPFRNDSNFCTIMYTAKARNIEFVCFWWFAPWHLFWRWAGMKLTASHKDLLLILGVVVAIIISITIWLHDANPKSSQITPPLSPKINSSPVKKIGQAVFKLTLQLRSGVLNSVEWELLFTDLFPTFVAESPPRDSASTVN